MNHVDLVLAYASAARVKVLDVTAGAPIVIGCNMNVEAEVMARYSEGARGRQESLCCPISYDRDLLALLPDEIVERDYGCGDQHVMSRRATRFSISAAAPASCAI